VRGNRRRQLGARSRRVFLVHYDPVCSILKPTDCEQWHVIGQVDSLTRSPAPTP